MSEFPAFATGQRCHEKGWSMRPAGGHKLGAGHGESDVLGHPEDEAAGEADQGLRGGHDLDVYVRGSAQG